MNFQTVFYRKINGEILRIEPNKYIKSKFEKSRFCPGIPPDEINFMYFQSGWPLDPAVHRIHFVSPTHPPFIVGEDGIPLFCTDRMLKFIKIAEQYDTIIVDLADSMGDQLLRVACVIAAQEKYPKHRFFCKCEAQYFEVLSLCPDITLFTGYKEMGLDADKCGKVFMNGGHLYDPRGDGFNKACVYGTWLNLSFVPYHVRLVPPEGFNAGFSEFDKEIGLREDKRNITLQLRSKEWEGKCWSEAQAVELADLIHSVYDCSIFWVGCSNDVKGEPRGVVNLTGKTTWIQTVHLLEESSHVFCIDSSVQHLSRALGIDYFCLWGLTHPQQIVGEPPRPHDFVASIATGPTDIKSTTPMQVFARAFPEHRRLMPLHYDPARNTSQHGDQEIIFAFFITHPPKNHIAVDVGAFGRDMSNTFALLELGWKGLLIEANPDRCKVIEKEFAGLDVTIVNAGVGSSKKRMPLHLHSELGHDSLLPDWYPQDKTDGKVVIDVYPLETLLREHAIPVDFDLLSIDTEGMDDKIIRKLFTGSDFRPRLIVTECTSYGDPIGLFKRFGYTLLARTGNPEYGNFIFSRE